jgi:hypothetical protein
MAQKGGREKGTLGDPHHPAQALPTLVYTISGVLGGLDPHP